MLLWLPSWYDDLADQTSDALFVCVLEIFFWYFGCFPPSARHEQLRHLALHYVGTEHDAADCGLFAVDWWLDQSVESSSGVVKVEMLRLATLQPQLTECRFMCIFPRYDSAVKR